MSILRGTFGRVEYGTDCSFIPYVEQVMSDSVLVRAWWDMEERVVADEMNKEMCITACENDVDAICIT